MAGDMVASVTLRLRDQMSVGIDEIKRQFGSVQATLDRLTGVMGDLQNTMDGLRMPPTMNAALASTITEADATTKAVAAIGVAAKDSAAMMASLEIPAIPHGAINPMIPQGYDGAMAPGGGAKTAGIEDAREGLHPAVAGAGDWLTDGIMGALAVGAGVDSIKARAGYDTLLRHAAIAEHLNGAANQDQVRALRIMLDRLALKDRQSSLALAQAYYYLATTQMSPKLIDAIMPAIGRTSTAYNTDPNLMGHAAYALSDSFKIAPGQMEGALAAMAMAAKLAHFNVEDFGAALPMIGASAAISGLTGRGGFDQLAAALETVRKNTNLSSESATDVNDLIQQLHSQMVNKGFDQAMFKNTLKVDEPLFAKYHIKPVDLRHLENQAALHGVNPLTAVLDYIHKQVKPMTPTDEAFYVSSLFGNQQSRTAVLSLLQHWKSYHGMIKTLGGVDQDTVSKDFTTAMKGADTELRLFDENLTEINRGIGKTVLPVMRGFTGAMSWLEAPPKRPTGMTPAETKQFDAHPRRYVIDNPSAVHEHTEAIKDNTAALREGQAMAMHVNAHPTGPSAPAGQILNRP